MARVGAGRSPELGFRSILSRTAKSISHGDGIGRRCIALLPARGSPAKVRASRKVLDRLLEQSGHAPIAAAPVDEAGDPGVGHADEGRAILDRAQAQGVGLIALKDSSGFWLVGLYALLIILSQIIAPMLMILALTDIWVDYRTRFAKKLS